MSSKMVTIENLTLETETSEAYLVVKDGEKTWLPKSQVSDLVIDSDRKVISSLRIPLWLAENHGLD